MTDVLTTALAACPVVAILRGVRRPEAPLVMDMLAASGVRVAEIPLNSPDAFTSIRDSVDRHGAGILIGAGTVLTVDDARRCADAGARFVLAPNFCPDMVTAALRLGMVPVPGVATATEAMAAFALGIRWVKVFPVASVGLGFARALRAVAPSGARFMATGGVTVENAGEWLGAGWDAVGIGSELYRPDMELTDFASRARSAIRAVTQAPTARRA